MKLNNDICYRALKTRDLRFDGQFFTAVKSTGIFCRPICPATTPKRENCTFYDSADAALNAGYRPCLRCRPESAPASPAWKGTETTVKRALRLIDDGGLDHDQTVTAMAERLGITERHLARLFRQHLGSTPKQVAQTRRLMFAKRLLHQTDTPITDIALASGFNSLRRFNDAYQKAFGFAPSKDRKKKPRATGQTISLRFPYRLPYDWDGLLEYFRGRAIPPVETVDDTSYQRNIEFAEHMGTIKVSNDQIKNTIVCEISGIPPLYLQGIAQKIRRMFDIDSDPHAIQIVLYQDPILRPYIDAHPGLRLPGAWDEFEIAVRAIIGQQISVKAARTITTRVVKRVGKDTFPTPEDITTTNLDQLGLTGRRIDTLKNLAAQWQGLDRAKPTDQLIKDLCALPGIGPWTAHYLLMRALGEPDIYPVDDLALIRGLEKCDQPSGKKELKAHAEQWRPWRAYGALYLWKAVT